MEYQQLLYHLMRLEENRKRAEQAFLAQQYRASQEQVNPAQSAPAPLLRRLRWSRAR